jgi:hypothetical protein
MTLTQVVVLGPPETRRFRLLAPVLVLLGLAFAGPNAGHFDPHRRQPAQCAGSAHRGVHDVRGSLEPQPRMRRALRLDRNLPAGDQ